MQERRRPYPTKYPREVEDEGYFDYPLNEEFWTEDKWYQAEDMWGNEVTVIGESHPVCVYQGHEIGGGHIVLDRNGLSARFHELRRR
jgi:hypothetical protein